MKAISLVYHDLIDGTDWDASGFPGSAPAEYKLTVDRFARHLDALSGLPRRPVISVFDLEQHGSGSETLPLLLTFDDGGISAATHTARMLEQRGLRGHFLVTTDCIGQPGFLTEGQITELDRNGHFIGSHSCSHPTRMSHCSDDQLLDEWSRSIDLLTGILGRRVTLASVPGGYYSDRVARAASRAGIRFLFNSEPVTRARVVDTCLVLGRYWILRDTTAATAARLAGSRSDHRLWQYAFWNAKKVAKAVGGRGYLALRRRLLGRRRRDE